MNNFPTKLVGTDFNLLVSTQGHNVLLTGCHCSQFLTPKDARQLANVLCEAAARVEEEMNKECVAIFNALNPAQFKLLEKMLSAVKESDQ